MNAGTVPPFYPRVRERLENCDQPLFRIHGWPDGGARRALHALAQEKADECVWIGEQGTWGERLAIAMASGKPWILCAEEPSAEASLQAAGALGSSQRLVFASLGRNLDEILPERVVGPDALRLTAAETAELFAGAAVGRVGELMEFTEGWFGPLVTLRRRWPESGGTVGTVVGGEGVMEELARHVLDPLPASIQRLLTELVHGRSLDLSLWSLVWRREPEKIRELVELTARFHLPLDQPPRLPHLLQRAVQWRFPGPDPDLHRRLARAHAALGQADQAADHFEQAGDGEGRRRIEVLGVGGAKRPARKASPPSVARRYSFHLFGHPVVYRPGPGRVEVEVRWRLRRAFETVAYLALAPDARASKAELVTAIWSDASESSLRKNFHPTLSEARRTLGGGRSILFNQGRYSLHPEIEWEVDVHRFLSGAEQGREILAAGGPEVGQEALEAWQKAWRLYQGPLMLDHEGAWIETERRRLREIHLKLLADLGDLAAAEEKPTLALDAYRSVLLEDPFEERIHLAVMRLYAAQGRRDLVRRQYVRLQELFLEELGVEPSPTAREQYHLLMG